MAVNRKKSKMARKGEAPNQKNTSSQRKFAKDKRTNDKQEPGRTYSKPKAYLRQVSATELKKEVARREAAKKSAAKKSPQGRADQGKTKTRLTHNSKAKKK
jgi:hypothetical protein